MKPTDAFIKLCKLHQVDEDSAITLRDYLHNIGVFFYQKNGLSNQIILDQKWAIDAVYTLFDRESRFYELIEAKNGLFQAKDLAKSWQNYTQAEREVFIGFMLQCEICFELNANRTPFDEKEWVAPSLLPKKSPVSVNSHFRDDDNTVRFLQYRFDFLHSGVIQSFIVRTHKLSNQHSMWRNGIWLDDGNAMALLRADEVQKTITIQVKGSNSKTLLDKIRNLFNEIHDLKPAEWVSNHGKSYLPLVEIENNIHLMNFTYSGERYNVTDYQYFLNVNPNARFSMDKLSVLKEEKEKKFLEWKRLIEMRGNAGVDSIGDYKNAILKVNAKLLELEEEIKQEEANQQNETQKSTAKDSIVIGVRSNLPNQQDETQNPSKVQQVPAPNSLTTVLMLTAIPAGRPKLNLDKEHSAILFKLQKQPSKFDFQLRKTVTINDFKEFPEEIKPDILHFSGHGVSGVQSGIVVQNDDHNGETIIPTKGLEQLFVYYKSEQLSIKAVLLNACYSAKQAAVIAKQVPFVIGTTIPINDDRAIAFSTGFYFKLEKEVDIERAFQSGVTAARLKGAAAKDFVLYKDGKKITSK